MAKTGFLMLIMLIKISLISVKFENTIPFIIFRCLTFNVKNIHGTILSHFWDID